MSHVGPSAAVIRTLVEVDTGVGPTRLVLRQVAKEARVVVLDRLGPAWVTTKLELPPEAWLAAHLPHQLTFLPHGGTPARLSPLLSGARHVRLIALGSPTDPAWLTELLSAFEPDIVWLAGDAARATAALALDPSLSPYVPSVDQGPWGLGPIALHANGAGSSVLQRGLSQFASSHGRRQAATSCVYDVDELVLCEGFYPVETEAGASWAWTGLGSAATFLVPWAHRGLLRLSLFFVDEKGPLAEEGVQALVEGQLPQAQYVPAEHKIVLETYHDVETCCLRVELRQNLADPERAQSRRLGYALHKAKVEVVP